MRITIEVEPDKQVEWKRPRPVAWIIREGGTWCKIDQDEEDIILSEVFALKFDDGSILEMGSRGWRTK